MESSNEMIKLHVVTRCSLCPFFEDSPIKRIGGVFTAALLADSEYGLCNLLPNGDVFPTNDLKIGLPPGPDRDVEARQILTGRDRRVVKDKHAVPEDCPLRQSDWTITLQGGN